VDLETLAMITHFAHDIFALIFWLACTRSVWLLPIRNEQRLLFAISKPSDSPS
jgi:hypothetical protein